MYRYILDTHVLLWFLEEKPRLPKNIYDEIKYFQHKYFVSFLSLIEIDNIRKLGKVVLKYTFLEIIEQLRYSSIEILFGNKSDLETLSLLEMKIIDGKSHGDYIDRTIIATAIANQCTCISADTKFPFYEKNGLKLLQI